MRPCLGLNVERIAPVPFVANTRQQHGRAVREISAGVQLGLARCQWQMENKSRMRIRVSVLLDFACRGEGANVIFIGAFLPESSGYAENQNQNEKCSHLRLLLILSGQYTSSGWFSGCFCWFHFRVPFASAIWPS